MPADFLSPKLCAEAVVADILAAVGVEDEIRHRKVHNLCRQLVRDVMEQCASLAEDYVRDNYPNDHPVALRDIQEVIADGIAEQIRQAADERVNVRVTA